MNGRCVSGVFVEGGCVSYPPAMSRYVVSSQKGSMSNK